MQTETGYKTPSHFFPFFSPLCYNFDCLCVVPNMCSTIDWAKKMIRSQKKERSNFDSFLFVGLFSVSYTQSASVWCVSSIVIYKLGTKKPTAIQPKTDIIKCHWLPRFSFLFFHFYSSILPFHSVVPLFRYSPCELSDFKPSFFSAYTVI